MRYRVHFLDVSGQVIRQVDEDLEKPSAPTRCDDHGRLVRLEDDGSFEYVGTQEGIVIYRKVAQA